MRDVSQPWTATAAIDDIGDVVITAAASGQMLRCNGSSWVNEDIGSDVTNVTPGQLLRAHRPGVVTLALEDLALVGVVENRTSEDLNWLP